jgi:uncharacterized membrane protein
MKSKAHIAGRPIHPMLVGLPIALFAATIGLELAHLGTHDASYYRAAMVANIAGVLMALLAVIPGALDLVALPARSPARSTGIRHAGLNVLTIGVFATSGVLLFRGWTGRELVDGVYALDAHIPLAFGMIGIVAMTYAAALGYALLHTHQVGGRPTILRAIQQARDQPARDFSAALHP